MSMEDFTAHATQALPGLERIVLISMNAIKILATQMQHAQTQFLRMNVFAKQASRERELPVPISTNA